MRIVFISDTHERHNKMTIPDGDVLVHAGDFTLFGAEAQIIEFNRWLGTLPHLYKFVTPGNHDFNMQYKRDLITNAKLFIDEAFILNGVKFYFSPFTPRFGMWAYMLPRGKSLFEKWLEIPADVDVLVTHGPPHGILDTTAYGEHAGCADLLAVVEGIRPKIHVFGHIHHSYGASLQVTEDGDILYLNAAMVDENYQPKNTAHVVDFDRYIRQAQIVAQP